MYSLVLISECSPFSPTHWLGLRPVRYPQPNTICLCGKLEEPGTEPVGIIIELDFAHRVRHLNGANQSIENAQMVKIFVGGVYYRATICGLEYNDRLVGEITKALSFHNSDLDPMKVLEGTLVGSLQDWLSRFATTQE